MVPLGAAITLAISSFFPAATFADLPGMLAIVSIGQNLARSETMSTLFVGA
jgi:hypothetical protein